MEECYALAQKIAALLRGSECYEKYHRAKRAVSEDRELTLALRDFKRAQLEYHTKLFENHEPSFEDEKYISGLYSGMMLNADAKAYLECERELLDTILKVQSIVAESCGIDMDF